MRVDEIPKRKCLQKRTGPRTKPQGSLISRGWGGEDLGRPADKLIGQKSGGRGRALNLSPFLSIKGKVVLAERPASSKVLS